MTTTTQTNIFLSADDDLNKWLISDIYLEIYS